PSYAFPILTLLSFCFNATSPAQLYTLSLHDALPISPAAQFTPGAGLRPRERWRTVPVRHELELLTRGSLQLPDFDAPLRELGHVVAEWHRLVRCVHPLRCDAAVHLHQAGDGKGVSRGAHH